MTVVDARGGGVIEELLELTHGSGVDVVVDYVSTASTLEAGAKSLGRRGRLVTLGGAGQPFQASSLDMLNKELDLLGSRYVTRREILETCNLVARGEVWSLVSDIRPRKRCMSVSNAVRSPDGRRCGSRRIEGTRISSSPVLLQ
jgi:threonine dehydrogenase-like Zn-dependent dehydrogenase